MVADPVPEKVATLFWNVTMLLLEVQVAEPETSVPFRVAENVADVRFVKVGPLGLDEMIKPCPLPVTVPVAEPPIPDKVAVTVTPDVAPMPFTFPEVTVAQGVELCQRAELVTSLLPLL